MHIERCGEHGRDLLLIHGWAMHAGIFAPLRDALAAHFRLHLVDLPGHGRSRDDHSRLELAEIGDEIAARVPNAIWLGWSLGGLVALDAAARLPHALRGLLMLCASPRFVAADDWPHGVALRVFSDFERGLRLDYRATIDRFLALEAHGSEHMREELRALREQVFALGEPLPEALRDGLHLLEHSDLRAALPTLTVPSLWLAGRRDRLVHWQAMQASAAMNGNAQFAGIAGAGHAPFLTHAAELATAITAFSDPLP
ncbi:MAG: pimeloyl-[acyl-carrier protein] methyl ester esterase [Lysobacterales bacterium CG_4_10_14_3_um_filter_64_11]|nr:MAG: pimeloyl-[acyl-carrier protein] methyl ester esterase [Xanthomonadales bacterium CG_4_10_14_3_um_filter_64_11]